MQKRITHKSTNIFFFQKSMFPYYFLNNSSKLKNILYKTKKGNMFLYRKKKNKQNLITIQHFIMLWSEKTIQLFKTPFTNNCCFIVYEFLF